MGQSLVNNGLRIGLLKEHIMLMIHGPNMIKTWCITLVSNGKSWITYIMINGYDLGCLS